MRASQIIVLATPAFLALILLEFAVGWWRQRRGTGHQTYRLADAISSIGLGMLSQTSAVFTRVLRVGIYTAVVQHLSLVPANLAHAFWTSLPGWLLALLFYDFCYYWLHRMGHECALLWAAHVVHHQSQDYNLSTALRQTSSGALFGWIFYLPMALAGVPPLVFGVVALVDLLYQFWVHTEQVGTLGWFDRWFCSPSNHRVHHAVNDGYVDRNYGGILVVWDRWFGSFEPEDPARPCVYGTRKPLNSWDPVWANLEVYAALARDSWRARHWGDKLRVWLKPPGWRPPDVAERWPQPPFSLQAVRRFNPPLSRRLQVFAGAQFVLLLAGVAAFLWHADTLSAGAAWVGFVVLTVDLWALSVLLQGRLDMGLMLYAQAACGAMASAALGWPEAHHVFKPLALGIAIIYVATKYYQYCRNAQFDLKKWGTLLLALTASLAGDCLLMFPGFFLPGLVAFLLAHVAYIVRLRIGVPWLADRRAALRIAAYALTMYALLLVLGLPAALRLPVAAYVACIAWMAAQAWGRAAVLAQQHAGAAGAAYAVAWGALAFVASDSLLAWNRFVQALDYGSLTAPFWVLSSYYLAQGLIVWGLTREQSPG